MATRFYLPATAATVPFSPAADADWEVSSGLARAVMLTTKIGDALSDVSYSDADASLQDICLRQYISKELTAGQTVTGGQAHKFQCRCSETNLANNLRINFGIRVINITGPTVKKTVRVIFSVGSEFATSLTNRAGPGNSASQNYTTVAGDYMVVEIGVSGNPGSGGTHSGTMRLGDSAESDLPENETDTTDKNPWVQFTDTLTFVAPRLAGAYQRNQSVQRAATY